MAHVGDGEPLAVTADHEHVYWVGMGEALEPDAERLPGESRKRLPSQEKGGGTRRDKAFGNVSLIQPTRLAFRCLPGWEAKACDTAKT